jgi:hypothetical protein
MSSLSLLGYIDPASGFIVLQILIAGVVGAAVFFRRILWGGARLITGRRATTVAAEAQPGDAATVGGDQGSPVAPSPEPVVETPVGDGMRS